MHQLSREQTVAINVFLAQKPHIPSLLMKGGDISYYTGFMAARYSEYKLAQLPAGKHWTWNQSNARVAVQIDPNTLVVLKKVSPRLRIPNSGHQVPSYKVWIVWVKCATYEYYFLWCEKGDEPGKVCVETEIGPVYPEQISVESLSFLLPFIDDKSARELGWM